MTTTPIPTVSAPILRDRLAAGDLTAVELARACIERIETREPEIRAWAWFDPAYVLREAERLDALRASGAPLGPLHGLPVGLKDIIDTAGIPTENGCTVDAGRVPREDAAIVRRFREAGALIIGKTVTTELAFLHPGKTRNPRNPGHTPGGSSSGSAAAVADGMIPLAVGTQTGGSVIRPASFCGITGFKPSFGAIPRAGVCMQSHSLDTLGVFARDPEGAELLAAVLMGGQGADTVGEAEHNVRPRLAHIRLPGQERADPALSDAMDVFREALGPGITDADLPSVFGEAATHRARINAAEMAHYYRRYMETGEDRLGPETRDAIREGMALPATDYIEALGVQAALTPALEPLFAEYDALLCPAALGPAPEGLGSTGDSIFNGLWTMAGTPAITLPLLAAPNGLPMGVQLVGRAGEDARLLAAANWVWREMGATPR